jgi:hypothetical protein
MNHIIRFLTSYLRPLVEWLRTLLQIREVPVLILGSEADHSDVRGFLYILQANAGIVAIRLWLFHPIASQSVTHARHYITYSVYKGSYKVGGHTWESLVVANSFVGTYFRERVSLKFKIMKYFLAFGIKINLPNFIKFVFEKIFGIGRIHMKYYSPEICYILSDAGSKQCRERDSSQRNAKTAIQIVMTNRCDVCLRYEGIDLAFS